jgi:hypothetical protein
MPIRPIVKRWEQFIVHKKESNAQAGHQLLAKLAALAYIDWYGYTKVKEK